MTPVLVARLCSVTREPRFLRAGLSDVSGLVVAAFDLVYCSLSVLRYVFALTLISSRRKVVIGLCATSIL